MRPDQDDRGTEEPRPAGPVGAGDPPPPAVAKASSGVGPPTPPPAGEGDQVSRTSTSLLADAEAERDEYLELAQRTKADFENFRKRMAAEVQAAQVRGKVELAQEVVPAVDDLERAIEAAGLDPEGDSERRAGAGVLLVLPRPARDAAAARDRGGRSEGGEVRSRPSTRRSRPCPWRGPSRGQSSRCCRRATGSTSS